MSTPAGVATGQLHSILAFDGNNRLAVAASGGRLALAFTDSAVRTAHQRLRDAFSLHTEPKERFTADAPGESLRVSFAQVQGSPSVPGIQFRSIEQLESSPDDLDPMLQSVLRGLEPHLIEIPYLNLGENDFIYKFRPEKERNTAIYAQDAEAGAIYQSQLCAVIKQLARRHERTATAPVLLDFGAVHYLVPSHFGFCLGVKNAIERAYETLTENPGKRVFMLSELIHNPFVNEDLIRRGLRYLQTDKGVPHPASPGGPDLWDTLTPDDIVIIPAFGATDEDKRRLVRKGIAVRQYDATCMLVEKVWKAARAYGRDGYTVVIHGKHEHEETKATFSNTRRYAPAIIVRNMEETRLLGEIILGLGKDPSSADRFRTLFAGKCTEGFDVERDLNRVAVVNQTTLLMNETREIISYLRDVFAEKFGTEESSARVGGQGRNDTLCYATQVNQDALTRALAEPLDAAFVIGGKNSSNTYQLYRLCEQRLGERAFFIQSEANILSPDEAEHYVFPAKGLPGQTGHVERRPLWGAPVAGSAKPRRILVTGGASCPDGIIQQVICRINSFYPPGSLRDIGSVLADLSAE
ncbi:MAG TPA: 4-hydroxy-3-methylbut-2-enyl diphosphate reductase [Opitutaceae bacterium]|nr:4-hydroxy-3-methylbut-2-enyl diphosphate reductase [Opitutaceae bacterium]